MPRSSHSFHVWFFTFCLLICALSILFVTHPFWVAVYIWTVLTPGLLFYAWFAYREGK